MLAKTTAVNDMDAKYSLHPKNEFFQSAPGRPSEDVKRGVDAIISGEGLLQESTHYEPLIDNEEIKILIRENPIIWFNIRQKLKGYIRKIQTMKPREVSKEKRNLINDLVLVFLQPDVRQEQLPYFPGLKELRDLIQRHLIHNPVLMEFITNHTPYSFVEQPVEIISRLDKMKKSNSSGIMLEPCNQIDWVIKAAIDRNRAGGRSKENEGFNFFEIHKSIIYYVERIYGLQLSNFIPEINSLDPNDYRNLTEITADIAKVLRQAMNKAESSMKPKKSSNKEPKKNMGAVPVAVYLKGLFAWGYLPHIRKKRVEACKQQKKIFELLDEETIFGRGVDVNSKNHNEHKKNIPSEFKEDHNEHDKVRTYEIKHKGKTYVFSVKSRVKSVESILTKLMADVNYNDVDSLLDLLGFRVIFGNMPEEVKLIIMGKLASLYGKNSFIFKNKGLLGAEGNAVLMGKLTKHPPLFQKNDKKARTAIDYIDAKFAGYPKNSEIGMEIQFFNNENDANPIGPGHHSIIEIFREAQGWARSAGYVTAAQFAYSIKKTRYYEGKESHSGLSFTSIWKEALNRVLVPYLIKKEDGEGESYVLFAYKGFESLLEAEFPHAFNLKAYKEKLMMTISEDKGL